MVNNNHPVDLPKTYTISYFDEVEWNKGLTVEEIEQQQEITNWQNQLGEFEKVVGPCTGENCGNNKTFKLKIILTNGRQNALETTVYNIDDAGKVASDIVDVSSRNSWTSDAQEGRKYSLESRNKIAAEIYGQIRLHQGGNGREVDREIINWI